MLDRAASSRLRAITPLDLPNTKPCAHTGARPEVREVSPTALLIDDDYQRNLSQASMKLIRRIVAEWDWKAFKPPIVAEVEGALHVIDGQHTTIAAATHPAIDMIPVLVVDAAGGADRAGAFVRHNRDRLGITQMQLHVAQVAAGDPDALTIQQVCDRAGARILKHTPGQGRFRPGDIVAIQGLRGLCDRRHAQGARRVIEICVRARMAPIDMNAVRAVEELLFAEQYRDAVTAEDITAALIEGGADLRNEALRISTMKLLSKWQGLTIALFNQAKKVRRGSKAG